MSAPILERKSSSSNQGRKIHSPNLDSIEMIENIIEENHDFRTVTTLYNSLPRKMQHATFKRVLKYLEKSNKIAYDKNGAVFWIFERNEKDSDILEQQSTSLR